MFKCVIPSYHKGNGYSMTCLCRHRGRQRYSSNPFTTWHSEVGGQYHALAALLPGKVWYPFSGDGWYEKLTPMGIPSSDCPACSMSLYQLNYPDCLASNYTGNKLSHTEVIVRQSTFTSIMLIFTCVKRMQIAEISPTSNFCLLL